MRSPTSSMARQQPTTRWAEVSRDGAHRRTAGSDLHGKSGPLAATAVGPYTPWMQHRRTIHRHRRSVQNPNNQCLMRARLTRVVPPQSHIDTCNGTGREGAVSRRASTRADSDAGAAHAGRVPANPTRWWCAAVQWRVGLHSYCRRFERSPQGHHPLLRGAELCGAGKRAVEHGDG